MQSPMYDIFEPSLMNVKMKAQETSTLSQPKKLASRIQTSPQSQINSSNKSKPMSQSNPFHKRETIKSSALPDYGLHSDRSRGEFAVSAAISPALQPQQLQRASGARAGSTSAATAFSGETRKISLSARSVSAIPTASTSTSGVGQYLASPCSTLPRSSSIQRIPLVAPQPTQFTPQDKKATYLTNN